MSIKRLDDGRYEVDIRPRGREGRRIRRKFERKSEAVAFERYTPGNANTKEWAGQRTDRCTLKELLDVWWKYHGQNHEHGAKEFNHLVKTINRLGDIPVSRMNKRLLMAKPDIPPNQAMHILRHTFASYFMMNGGNIIALQQILGHASIQQTMVYAHLSPDYLQNARVCVVDDVPECLHCIHTLGYLKWLRLAPALCK